MKPLSYDLAPEPALSEEGGWRSLTFDDVYFLPGCGEDESRYVFIEGNQLEQRWQQHDADHFVVAETGFGSGLNLAVTLKAWRKCQQKPQHLHFISFELYPFTVEQLNFFYQQLPEFATLGQRLCATWPSRRAGIHRIELYDDVTLTLVFGDCLESIRVMDLKVDAWYLDGFDPKKNPGMWTMAMFEQMSRCSGPGTTVATFTAASAVRKCLVAAGFAVTKRQGFVRKREMIIAQYDDSSCILPHDKQPWAPLNKAKISCDISIIGSGIAGLSLFHAFQKVGKRVTLISNTPVMSAASGNQAGLVMPMLTAQPSLESLLYWRAFDFALKQYQVTHFHQQGVLELVCSDKKKQWMRRLKLHRWPDDLLNWSEKGVHYPSAGWLDTQQLKCDWISVNLPWIHKNVERVEQNHGYWLLFDESDHLIQKARVLILAAGIGSRAIQGLPELPLSARHGQTSILSCPGQPVENQAINANGYIIPLSDSQYLLGASFDHLPESQWQQEAILSPDHAQRNLELWTGVAGVSFSGHEVVSGHAGIRATTPDHLPLCGPLVNEKAFKRDYADLHHGRHWHQYPEAKVIDNLYVLTGLGSRGFTSAPLLAQTLVDMILGRPLPLEVPLLRAIHPNRFLYRQMKKGAH